MPRARGARQQARKAAVQERTQERMTEVMTEGLAPVWRSRTDGETPCVLAGCTQYRRGTKAGSPRTQRGPCGTGVADSSCKAGEAGHKGCVNGEAHSETQQGVHGGVCFEMKPQVLGQGWEQNGQRIVRFTTCPKETLSAPGAGVSAPAGASDPPWHMACQRILQVLRTFPLAPASGFLAPSLDCSLG